MNKATLNSLILSLAVLTISSIGGAFIAQKLAEGEAGFHFLFFSCLVSSIILISQLLIFRKSQTRLLFQLVYFGFLGFSMAWFMLSLFFPIFWVGEFGKIPKLILFAIFLGIQIFNLNHGWRMFNKNWNKNGMIAFETEFGKAPAAGDWNKVMKKINMSHDVAVPGIPEKWMPALSPVLIVFMVLGLSLRTALPVFSIFAWGIPAIVMASYFVQVSGSYFSQAAKVKILETGLNVFFSSTQ